VGMQIVASTFAGTFYGRVQQLLARVKRPDLELKLIGGGGALHGNQGTPDPPPARRARRGVRGGRGELRPGARRAGAPATRRRAGRRGWGATGGARTPRPSPR